MMQDMKETEEDVIPAFAYQLLRNELLPDLLGQDEKTMLYWAGKHLARKFPLENIEDICDFFHRAAWGELSVLNLKKNKAAFELKPKGNHPSHFQLEAGFLAEQLQNINKCLTETFEQPKKNAVLFTVESNPKEKVAY